MIVPSNKLDPSVSHPLSSTSRMNWWHWSRWSHWTTSVRYKSRIFFRKSSLRGLRSGREDSCQCLGLLCIPGCSHLSEHESVTRFSPASWGASGSNLANTSCRVAFANWSPWIFLGRFILHPDWDISSAQIRSIRNYPAIPDERSRGSLALEFCSGGGIEPSILPSTFAPGMGTLHRSMESCWTIG